MGQRQARGRIAGPMLALMASVAVAIAAFGGYQFLKYRILQDLASLYPSTSNAEKKSAALAASAHDLDGLAKASDFWLTAPVSMIFPKDLLESRSYEVDGTTITIRDASISGGEQELLFQFDFEVLDADQRRVTGHLEGGAFASIVSTSRGTIDVALAPVLYRWRFDEISIGASTFFGWSIVEQAMRGALDRLATLVSTRISSYRTQVAAQIPAKTLHFQWSDGIDRAIDLPAVNVNRSSLRIERDRISILVGTDITGPRPSTVPAIRDFAAFSERFEQVATQQFHPQSFDVNQPHASLSMSFAQQFLKWLPGDVTIQEQIHSSETANRARLMSIPEWSAGMVVPAAVIESVTQEQIARALESSPKDSWMRKLTVRTSLVEQAIKLEATVERFPIGQGSVSGSLTGFATPLPGSSDLRFALGFDQFTTTAVELNGWKLDPAAIQDVVLQSFGVLLPKVNALLPPLVLHVDPIKPTPLDLNAIAVDPSVRLKFSPGTVELPELTLGQSAVVVNPSGIGVMLKPTIGAIAVLEGTEMAESPARNLTEAFAATWKHSFADDLNWQETTAALNQSLLARYLLASFPSEGLSAQLQSQTTQDIPEQNLRFGRIGHDFDCERRHCERRRCVRESCSYHNSQCHRRVHCGREPGECDFSCTVSGPGYPCGSLLDPRWCESSFDDPICLGRRTACNIDAEARVASCNASEEARIGACNLTANREKAECDARAETNVGLCNAREETALGLCNITAEAELGACNVKKEALIGLNSLGNVGSVGGKVSVNGNGNARLSDLAFHNGLGLIEATVRIDARAEVAAEVDFNPRGSGYLLACPADVHLSPKTEVSIQTSLPLRAAGAVVELGSGDDTPRQAFQLTFDSIKTEALANPPPLDALFLNNPEFVLECPLVGTALAVTDMVGKSLTVLNGQTVAGMVVPTPQVIDTPELMRSGFVEVTSGKFYLDERLPPILVPIPNLLLNVGHRTLTALPRANATAVLFTVKSTTAPTIPSPPPPP